MASFQKSKWLGINKKRYAAAKIIQTAFRNKKAAKSLKQKYTTPSGGTPEVKFIDSIISTAVTFAGQINLLNGCVQGTDFNNRIGRKIEITSISVDLIFGGGTLTSANYVLGNCDKVRNALVWDKQPNQTGATYADIFTTASAATAPMSTRNVNNLERFEILKVWDQTIDTAGNLCAYMKDYIKCKLDVRYDNSNVGTVVDIITGALLLVSCDQNNTGVNQNTIQGQIRVRFRDM